MDWKTIDFDWNRARALLVTAEEGSYSAAARALGSTQPTIGRQVAALEEELGVTLVQRVGRGLELTEAGLDLIEHIRAMGDAARKVSLTATGRSRSLEGLVRITASESQCAFLLPPILARIRALHPGIELDLVATAEVRDLRKREADIALRNYRPKDPELTARKVREDRAWLYGTPAYLARLGPIESGEDLVRAELLAFDRTELLVEHLRAMGAPLTRENFPIATGNHLVQWAMCRAGLGLCFMMEHVGDAEPAVVRIPRVLPPMPVPLWLTTHRAVHTSRRLRAVFDLLAEGLRPG
ncbi:MAG: LysR family transcriptional regulator [Alphaproteobacteria bacterium]|nr:LysR family transcriptional regulator [Alphaproteobacteria bacterium]MCB9791089.1 LysR family transcriptional regulator [Alphaproteobacteria bacterium]